MIEGESKFERGPVNPESEDIKYIQRGVWADQLRNGQELPVGGSMFSGDLTKKLELDFESFDSQQFTQENILKAYEKSKDSVEDWLKKCGSDVDPYIFFVCFNVQKKMEELLKVNSEDEVSTNRLMAYRGDNSPKLSELKGKTECAERAALGQYLLQKSGLKSAYVSGITMEDAKDSDEFATDHSYIAIEQPNKPDETLIFDIARPHTGANNEKIARVLRTEVPFNFELLKDKEELLVGADDVLQNQRLYFGVGHPVAGRHEIAEK